MPQLVRLPDGSMFPINEGETEAQALAAAYEKYPDAWGAPAKGAGPKSGMRAAFSAGVEDLKGDVAALAGRAGIMDLAAAEKYRAEKQDKAKSIFKPTEDNWIESPLTKMGELIGGSAPQMVAPVVAGAAVAALPLTGAAATVAGLGAAGAASAGQFTATNLGRQMDEGKQLAQTDLGAAALAAVPQAALDMVGLRMLPGIRNMIFKATGKEVSKEAAEQIAKQGLKSVAKDYVTSTGKAMGAEGLTEAAQQTLERLQAGLNIGDADARAEYLESFVGGALLGGALAPAGRMVERSKIRSEQDTAARAEEAKRIETAAAEQQAALEAKRADPNYLNDLLAQSADYQAKIKALDETMQAAKPAKGETADPVAIAAARSARETKDALLRSDEYEAHQADLQEAAPALQEMRAAQAKAQAEQTAAAAAEREAKLADPAVQGPLRAEYEAVQQQEVDLNTQMRAAISAGDHPTYQSLVQQALDLKKRKEDILPQLGPLPETPKVPDMAGMQTRLAQLEGGVNAKGKPTDGLIIKLQQQGDTSGSLALSKEAAELRAQIGGIEDRVRLGEEMGAGREQASAQAARVAGEVSGIQRLAAGQEGPTQEVRKAVLAEKALSNEIRQMEAGRLNTDFTEQRTLPLTANPVQYTSAATMQRREQTLEGLKNELGALVQSARTQRVQGRVPDAIKEQITNKVDEIRDFQNAVARQSVPRGQASAGVAETLAGTRQPENLPRGQSVESVERAYTPETASTEAVQSQLAQLPAKLPPQDEALVQQITGALPALKNAGMPAETVDVPSIEGVPYDKVQAEMSPTRALDDVAAYLYKLRTGNDATTEAAQVQEHLARLEQGKRSETQTPTRETAWGTATKPTETAVQDDLFPDTELQGAIFGTYAEFENYLAGDAVKEARAAVGQTLATAARLQREIAPMEAELGKLRMYLKNLQDVQAFVIGAGDASVAKAQAAHQAAVDKLNETVAALEAKLDPQEKALDKAMQQLYAAVSAQVKVSDAIAKNTAKFNRDPGVQQAAAKVADAQAAHAAALKRATASGKADFTEVTRLYNASVTAINEQRTMLDAYAKDSRKLTERSILAYLNRDMQLMLRLRDATQTAEKARAAVDTAREVRDSAYAALQNAPETQETLRAASRDVSTAQGVLTKARNRAMNARVREAEAVAGVSDDVQALQKELADKAKPTRQARDARTLPPLEETKTQREEADAAQRKVENERAARLAAISGVKVTQDNMRQTLAEAEKLPERIRALDAAAKDETASQAARNKAKYEAANLRERAKLIYGAISNDPALSTAAAAELDARIAETSTKIGDKQIAVNEPGKAASTIRSRRKELTDLRTELQALQRLRKVTTNRATFAPVGVSKQSTAALADRAEQLETRIQTETDGAKLAGYRAELKNVNRELDRRDEAEQRLTLERGIDLETLGTTGKLPQRVIGPLVKKAMQAGKIMTGDTSTAGARDVAVRNKPQQSGKKRGVSAAQAMKQASRDTAHEQALLKMTEIEDLQERNNAALESARAAKDTAKIAKYEGFAERLKEGLARAQKRVDATASIEPEVTTLDDDEAASQFRSERQTTEVDDDVVRAVQDGRVLDAAKLLAARGSTPEVRARASKLVPLLMRTKIGVEPEVLVDGKSVAGKYDPGTNTITMAPGGINEEDLLHEMTHAATDRTLLAPDSTLTDDQRAAKRELEAMRKMVSGIPAFANEDIGNTREFAAEVFSNPALQSKLDSVGKPLTLWQRFVNLVGRLLGWGPIHTPGKPLSKQAEALVERIMQPSRKITTTASAAPSAWRAPKTDTTSALGKMADSITAKPSSPLSRLGHNPALMLETAVADMRAPLIKALSFAGEKALNQATYYVRKADALMNHVYASLSSGPLELVKTSKGNFEVRAGNGPSMRVLLDAVRDIKGVSPEDKMAKLQAYLAGQRAERVGWGKLDFANADELQKQAVAVKAELAADPAQKAALEKARKVYNEMNKGTVGFLAASGYISKAKAAELLQYGDYVPFYRVRADGIAELVMGESAVIRVGDIRNNKFLSPLVGDDQKLLPLNEAIVRNTMLLTDMAMKNLAAKDVAYALQKIGSASPVNGRNAMRIHSGQPPKGDDIIKFHQEPNPADESDKGERWMRIRTQGTALEHIPADMLVQSLEGSFSTLPAGLKAAAWFGDLLRAGVTRNPMYVVRQLIRDPLAATFTGGLDSGIVKSVFKTLGNYVEETTGRSKEGEILMRKGLTQSGIFTGDIDDINKMMLQITKGDAGALQKTLAWWDKAAMSADAATRIQMYKDAKARGLDDMEAELAAMEMMNFNKRGSSPTVQYAARMIPFLNAQIQGLNVLAKAMTGNMPQNEKLAIKEKFYRRALTMALFTIGYAMAMEDDETYKTARPRDRYNNWILPNPTGGEAIKLPIPFEVGLLFKALPEALVDVMRGDFNDEEFKAIRQAFVAQIPGSSSYGLPQMIKPVIEVVTNHNFFTEREIESVADRGKDSTERFGAGTTELSKEMSKIINATGIELSPKQIDHLISGYLGSVPVMIARLTNNVFASAESATRPTERASDSPIFGALFQRNLGGGPVDAAYAHEEALSQAKRTYDSMVSSGRKADAEAYKEDVLNVLGSPEMAKQFKSKIDLLQKADKAARNTIKDPDALRARLDELERKKHDAAKLYLDAVRQIAH